MSATDAGFLAALKEAQEGLAEGGIPVGAAIVNKQGEIIGKGRNSRIQTGSVILHVSTELLVFVFDSTAMLTLISIVGRNGRFRERQTPTPSRLPRCNALYDIVTMPNVHGNCDSFEDCEDNYC